MVGYSGTPLANKLGLKAPLTLLTIAAPTEYSTWLGPVPGVQFTSRLKAAVEAAHVFVLHRKSLEKHLTALRRALAPNGFVWVSWPKKSSKVETDVTEDTIREVALPMGFVDIKVCAVTDVWSGLKLVIRKSERP